jgi:choline-sulfatase
MPTLMDYLGQGAPAEDLNLPGHSMKGLLEGKPAPSREEVVVFDEYGPVRMIRTAEWKYVYRHAYGPHELWDLKNDPDERHNLIDDPGQSARVKELHGRMEEWFGRYVDPTIDGLRMDGASMGQTGPVWEPGAFRR